MGNLSQLPRLVALGVPKSLLENLTGEAIRVKAQEYNGTVVYHSPGSSHAGGEPFPLTVVEASDKACMCVQLYSTKIEEIAREYKKVADNLELAQICLNLGKAGAAYAQALHAIKGLGEIDPFENLDCPTTALTDLLLGLAQDVETATRDEAQSEEYKIRLAQKAATSYALLIIGSKFEMDDSSMHTFYKRQAMFETLWKEENSRPDSVVGRVDDLWAEIVKGAFAGVEDGPDLRSRSLTIVRLLDRVSEEVRFQPGKAWSEIVKEQWQAAAELEVGKRLAHFEKVFKSLVLNEKRYAVKQGDLLADWGKGSYPDPVLGQEIAGAWWPQEKIVGVPEGVAAYLLGCGGQSWENSKVASEEIIEDETRALQVAGLVLSDDPSHEQGTAGGALRVARAVTAKGQRENSM